MAARCRPPTGAPPRSRATIARFSSVGLRAERTTTESRPGLGPVALLVLLAAPARARLVATWSRVSTYGLVRSVQSPVHLGERLSHRLQVVRRHVAQQRGWIVEVLGSRGRPDDHGEQHHVVAARAVVRVVPS